jgi:formate/nitrite transporter
MLQGITPAAVARIRGFDAFGISTFRASPSGDAATNDGHVSERVFTPAGLDALPPLEMARKAEQVGVVKAGMSIANTFALSVLAGAFIALGAIFATTVTAGGADVPFGVLRLLGGLAFSLGLILVVVAGAELFTGNNLIVMAWASRRVRTSQVLRNWAIVYLGNLVGALATVGLLFIAKQYEFGDGAVGVQALSIAASKTSLGFVQAVALGAFCNGLVCLAVWLCYSARTTTDKILSIVPPIAAFVAAGFEHSVANMFFIPMGLLVKSDEAFVSQQNGLPDLGDLTWARFVTANLVPVTIGNVVGGALMVGAIYWFIYLRDVEDVPTAHGTDGQGGGRSAA